jgi:lipopolysaccharide export LptBFGC system permease protein LptF
MKEILQSGNLLFIESVKNHQKLVNILADARDENNISHISQSEMARLIGHSQTWVVKAIKRLNTEDTCVEMLASEKYVVHYMASWLKVYFRRL